MKTVTVHMVGNAHLDPVWLWPWQSGADEAIATCRSACHLLDEFPKAVFTRGEAWFYEQLRTQDPALFERVKAHIKGGRWSVVNGWWVQPDTNFPTEQALLATARVGLDWFKKYLELDSVPVAYLVDSFGHNGFLPRVIRNSGQRYFVMTRPGQREKVLPSELFRWRSPTGEEVLTCRLTSYGCASPDGGDMDRAIVGALAAKRPEGIDHVMCFYGVGNHGGGPTRKLVQWILEHQDYASGVRLEFSTPDRYFAAVEASAAACPVVGGELLHHAIGCYSVCGRLKREVRNAELAAMDAEHLAARHQVDVAQELDAVWKTICFNHFHDIIAGTSTGPATEEAQRQIGGARDQIEQLTYRILRRDSRIRHRKLKGHRVHVVNRSNLPWQGMAEVELWTDLRGFNKVLWSETTGPVPRQLVSAAGVLAEWWSTGGSRLLIPVCLEPGECQTFRLAETPAAVQWPGTPPRFQDGVLENDHLRVSFSSDGIEQIDDGGAILTRPLALVALADGSDTWSHDLDRYHGPIHARAEFGAPRVIESGPLRVVVKLTGQIGTSRVRLYVTLDRNSKRVDVRLDTNYQEPFTVLKASLALTPQGQWTRRDRAAGGWVSRALDGLEYPVHHAIRVEGEKAMGILFPDSFAADCSPYGTIRVTLLRNNVHAFHSNSRVPHEDLPTLTDRFGTDEGPQSLRFSLVGVDPSEVDLESHLAVLQRPPWVWDDYQGESRVEVFE